VHGQDLDPRVREDDEWLIKLGAWQGSGSPRARG
jgi:hypothetical protein